MFPEDHESIPAWHSTNARNAVSTAANGGLFTVATHKYSGSHTISPATPTVFSLRPVGSLHLFQLNTMTATSVT